MSNSSDVSEPSLPSLSGRAYGELLRIARAQGMGGAAGRSLTATALVHEAWLRLAESDDFEASGSSHFLAAASQAMRWVAVDHARRRRSTRLGTLAGERLPDRGQDERDRQLLDLDAGVERLGATHPDEAEVVVHRFFGGLSVERTAAVLGISTATVKRRWAFARAWLARELDRPVPENRDPPGSR